MSSDLFHPTYKRTLQGIQQGARRSRILSHFWRQPHKWPDPDQSKIFSCRAIDHIGRRRFGSAWTGKEFEAFSHVDDFPPYEETLGDYRSALEAYKPVNGTKGKPLPIAKLMEKYRASYDSAETKWRDFAKENSSASARLRASIRWLFERLRDGEIKTYLRLVETGDRPGEYFPVPDGFWNVEDVTFYRFREGHVDWLISGKPMHDGGEHEPEPVYIFFDRADLDRALLALDTPLAVYEQLDVPYLSPYLRLALAVIRQEKITLDNQSKKDVVLRAVRQLAPSFNIDPKYMSATLTDYLATIIREPESQDGRRPTKGQTPKKP